MQQDQWSTTDLVADWKDCTIAEENFSQSKTLVLALLYLIKYAFFTIFLDSIEEASGLENLK